MPLYVAYYRRSLPYFARVRELIGGGILGRLLYARVDLHLPPRKEDLDAANLPWRVDPEVAGGGYFYDMACHQIDLMQWFFGNPVAVQGMSFNRAGFYTPEDVVFAALEFEGGVAVNGSWCFVAAEGQARDVMTVYGTKGKISFSAFGFTPIQVETANISQTFLPANPENIEFCFIRDMVEELRGMRPVSCNGKEAAITCYLMDIILGKAREKPSSS